MFDFCCSTADFPPEFFTKITGRQLASGNNLQEAVADECADAQDLVVPEDCQDLQLLGGVVCEEVLERVLRLFLTTAVPA